MEDGMYNTKPASDWAEGYPIGNGRLGAMVISRGGTERQALNHDLLWRNYIKSRKSGTKADFAAIKELCSAKKYGEAENLLSRTQARTGGTIYINPFVPAADMYIKTNGGDENLIRSLIFDKGLAVTEYQSAGVSFRRESIASASDGVIITRLSSDKGAALHGRVSLSRIDDCECTITSTASPDTLTLSGVYDEGVSFSVAVRLYNRGGRLSLIRREYKKPAETSEKVLDLRYVFSKEEWYDAENGIETAFAHADELIIAAVISTDEENAFHSLTPEQNNLRKLKAFEERFGDVSQSWDEIFAAHLKVYKSIYGEERLSLGEAHSHSNEELLEECRNSGTVSPELAERLFSMSRYLCVASGMPVSNESSPISRKHPKAPINLQGLWNQDIYPAWESDYHMDLNIEMCYWSMEQLGLDVCLTPLMQWIERLLPQARELADDLYGCGGVAFNGCCDYRTIGRTDNVGYFWLGGAAWLADILWQRVEFTEDLDFLRLHLMPFMNEISDFFADILTEREDGKLYPPFGSSPEFAIKYGDSITYAADASTIDIELIYALFNHLSEAYRLIGKDEQSERNLNILRRLPMPTIKSDGMLSEFCDADYIENEPGHRHRSPLVGLCPGERITVEDTPDYAAAAYKLIKHRVRYGKSVSQAFAYSWDTQLLARLYKGGEAYESLCGYARIHVLDNLLSTGNDYAGRHGGLTWFAGQKLYQIEACISAGAGILDMIFSSRRSIMRFLPAIPESFGDGELISAPARGGFEVSFSWKNRTVSHISIHSRLGNVCRMYIPLGITSDMLPKGAVIKNNTAEFNTSAGCDYEIKGDLRCD